MAHQLAQLVERLEVAHHHDCHVQAKFAGSGVHRQMPAPAQRRLVEARGRATRVKIEHADSFRTSFPRHPGGGAGLH
eukprot:scaffold46009_cov298-Isochrysis_galbana.AAC.3